MKVGILIPTYNRVGYLKESLESALAQSHRDTEIIVIDNGSADGTADYMKTVDDIRVRYVVNDRNMGLAGSVNKGIGMFPESVRWCTILADDDRLDGDFVREALNAAARHNAKTAIDCRRIYIKGDGSVIRPARRSPENVSAFDYLKSRCLFSRETNLTGILFDRRTFFDISGYPVFSTGACSDDAFIFSLAMSDRLYQARSAIAYVRYHPEAESLNPSEAIRHIHTAAEYGRHMRSLLGDRARFSASTFLFAVDLLRLFTSILGDLFWINRANDLLPAGAGGEKPDPKALEELVQTVRKGDFPFTCRVRANAYSIEKAGINMESFLLYRIFFKAIIGFRIYYYKWLRSAAYYFDPARR